MVCIDCVVVDRAIVTRMLAAWIVINIDLISAHCTDNFDLIAGSKRNAA